MVIGMNTGLALQWLIKKLNPIETGWWKGGAFQQFIQFVNDVQLS